MLFSNQRFGKNVIVLISTFAIIAGITKIQNKQLSQLNVLEDKTNYLQEEISLKARAKLQQKIPAFGFDNLYADWTYLQFLQYFGDAEARREAGYSVVTDYFEIVVDRDPKFIQSHFVMSAANSLFAGRPEKTVELMNKVLETVTPQMSDYSFYLWSYKATDEILFLGDLETAKNSYLMAAKWAEMQDSELGNKMSERFGSIAKYLATDPDPTKAQFGAWMTILSSSRDEKVKSRVLEKLKDLGAEINISPDGKLEIKPPKNV